MKSAVRYAAAAGVVLALATPLTAFGDTGPRGNEVVSAPAKVGPSYGDPIIDGYGIITDDLSDEPTLQQGSGRSNWVGVWQSMLWAMDLLPYNGIDCSFGPQTHNATKEFQRIALDDPQDWEIDGIVGPDTRAAANGRMHTYSFEGDGRIVRFTGRSGRRLSFRRDGAGDYSIYTSPGRSFMWKNSVTLPQCR